MSRARTLGDINNVILNEKGDVVAVTIGVGGFLGIGEKNVGVPFEALEFETDEARTDSSDERKSESAERREKVAKDRDARFDSEHSDIRIVLDATKQQLESAPEFVWLDDQRTDDARDKPIVR